MSLDYVSVTAMLDAHADMMHSRLEPPPAEEMPLTVYDDEPMAGKTVHRGTAPTRKFERSRGTSQSASWPEPRPIAHELRPVPPFQPETRLPEVLRAWVMDEAERMPCPLDYVAAAALVALGSLIGAGCAIKPKQNDSWLIVPNLWGAVVGDPSTKKSPALDAGLRPLDRLITNAHREHDAARREYEGQMLIHTARKDAIEGRVEQQAKKSGQGLAEIARELGDLAEPETPKERRCKTNDTTVEKLGELLRDNPSGILAKRDELVGLIASWDREGRERERAFWLEAWNGNQHFETDRVGRGHVRIENVCVSLIGGIQPDKLIAYLEEAVKALANDGMLQRFQFLVYPDHRCWEWRDRSPNKEARDSACAVFEKLAGMDAVALGAAPADDFAKFPYFRFGPDAQEVFIEWSTDLHRARIEREDNPIIRQHLAKYDKLFPALALILHLVDCVHRGITGPVGKDAALRAAAWCEYLEGHAWRCYGLLADAGQRAAQALSDRIKRGMPPDGFTARDVRRNQWRHLTADEAVRAALDWLEGEGWVRRERTPESTTGGRPTVRYRINPALPRKQDDG